MASNVYSTRFIGVSLGTGTTATYTVPTGYVAVIRDISATATTTGSTNAEVFVNGAFTIWNSGPITNGSTLVWSGRQVLNAGDVLSVHAVGATTQFMVSGYLLTLP